MKRRTFLASLAALLGLGAVVPKAITGPAFTAGGFVARTGRLVMGVDHGIGRAASVASLVLRNKDGGIITIRLPPSSYAGFGVRQ